MITTADSPASPPLATCHNAQQATTLPIHNCCWPFAWLSHGCSHNNNTNATNDNNIVAIKLPQRTSSSTIINAQQQQKRSQNNNNRAHVDNNCIGRQPVANNNNTTPFFAVANSKCVAATFSCFNIKAQKQQCLQQ